MPARFRCYEFKPRRLFSRSLFLCGMVSLIGINVIGQNAYPDAAGGLRLNEVNSHAASHFLRHFFPNSTVKWVRNNHYYIACFNSVDSRTRVHYKSNGIFAFCLKYYPADGLNGDLKSTIFKKFPGCQIRVITELTDDRYKKAIFVHIKDGLYLETLQCDDEGIEITENILDAGI